MSLRYLAGYITESYNPLKVPNAPTIGTATAGDAQITITFTAPSNVGGGAITSYIAVATKTSDGTAVSATGSASPITITGLTNNAAYTVQVCAVNAFGPGPYSSPSGSVTPIAPKLYSWGLNSNGQLGNGTNVRSSSPVQVGALTNWDNISAGYTHSLFTKQDNSLWAVGQNNAGKLGDNTTVTKSSPVQIGALTNWSKVSGGYDSSFAIKTDGSLWSWGSNSSGALGQNIASTVNRSSPVQVGTLTNWLNVSSGNTNSMFTCAVKTDGTMWSWGHNQYGQLGQNNLIYRSSPVQVGALTNWINVSSGGQHAVAVKTDGTLWAWGRGLFGGIGDGNEISRSSPVQVGSLTTWSIPSAGYGYSGAIKTDGTLWMWGQNSNGQLGQNNLVYCSSPVQVGALTNWLNVTTGDSHVIGIATSGRLYTWGLNNNGQLGQNDTVNRSSPVQVGSNATWIKASASQFSIATSS